MGLAGEVLELMNDGLAGECLSGEAAGIRSSCMCSYGIGYSNSTQRGSEGARERVERIGDL
jgi:hypothetical protein